MTCINIEFLLLFSYCDYPLPLFPDDNTLVLYFGSLHILALQYHFRIFRGYMVRKYARNLKILEKERQKRAAIKIQRYYSPAACISFHLKLFPFLFLFPGLKQSQALTDRFMLRLNIPLWNFHIIFWVCILVMET